MTLASSVELDESLLVYLSRSILHSNANVNSEQAKQRHYWIFSKKKWLFLLKLLSMNKNKNTLEALKFDSVFNLSYNILINNSDQKCVSKFATLSIEIN